MEYSVHWSYSAGGRIASLVKGAGAAGVASAYHYTDAAHTAAVTMVADTGGTDVFSYDAAGRMLSRTVDEETTALTWDVTSSLVGSNGQGGHVVYAYDASGQRVVQARVADANSAGTASAYVASGQVDDPNTAVVDPNALTATRHYTFAGSTVAMRTSDPTVVHTDQVKLFLMLGDEQGSTNVMMPVHVQASGALAPATLADAAAVTRTSYTPYGQLRGADNLATDRGWLGQVEDRVDGASGTGLTYLNARYYDPTTMRFISPDPLMNPGDPKTLDPYRYADNNPVVFTDASGLRPACASGGARDQDACYYGTKGVELNPYLANPFEGSGNREYDRGMNGPKRPHKYPGSNISGLDAGILWLLPDFSSSAGKTTFYSDGDRMVESLKKTNHYQSTLVDVLKRHEGGGDLHVGQVFDQGETYYWHGKGKSTLGKGAMVVRDGWAAAWGEQGAVNNEALAFLGSHNVTMTVTGIDRHRNDDGTTAVRVNVGIVATNATTVESFTRYASDGFGRFMQGVHDFPFGGYPAQGMGTESQELRFSMEYNFTVGAG